MVMKVPLRYRVANWRRLPECLSNNSSELSITVSDILLEDQLTALRISVVHKSLGTLFTYIINASGSIVSPDKLGINLSEQDIMKELARFGFDIEFEPKNHLTGSQVKYLITLQGLGYDKIRHCYIKNGRDGTTQDIVTAFILNDHPKWLEQNAIISEYEYLKALYGGSATNVSRISTDNGFDWTWLNYVASIDDIIADNQNFDGDDYGD